MGIRGVVVSNPVSMITQVVPSAASITIPSGDANLILRITGAVAITNIAQPLDNPYFVGPIHIFNTDAAVGTLATGGNIALGVTLTRYKVFILVFDAATGLWYPSAIS